MSGARPVAHIAPKAAPPRARPNDLPPRWDGHPITWSAWSTEEWTTWWFHARPVDQACTACGLIELRATAAGTIHRPDGDTRLSVSRCQGCAHDVAYDTASDALWDLEPEDYLDDGSHPPATLF